MIIIIIILLIILFIFAISQTSENFIPKNKVVVSFTTIPSRLQYITETLEEIRKQTLLPDTIYINIPLFSKRLKQEYIITPDLQEKILNFLINSEIKIIRCEDFGPATKLLGSINEITDPNTIIITLDDDMVYHKNVIINLVKYAELYKNNVICLNAVLKPEEYVDCGSKKILDNLNILEGFGGVAYKRYFISEDIIEYMKNKICDSCFLSDDLVLSAFMHKHNIKIMRICGLLDKPIEKNISNINPLYKQERKKTYKNCIISLEKNGFIDFIKKLAN